MRVYLLYCIIYQKNMILGCKNMMWRVDSIKVRKPRIVSGRFCTSYYFKAGLFYNVSALLWITFTGIPGSPQ